MALDCVPKRKLVFKDDEGSLTSDPDELMDYILALNLLSGEERGKFTKQILLIDANYWSPEDFQKIDWARTLIKSNRKETLPNKILLAAFVVCEEQDREVLTTSLISSVLSGLGLPVGTISTTINQMLDPKSKDPFIEKFTDEEDEPEKKKFKITLAGESMIRNLLHE